LPDILGHGVTRRYLQPRCCVAFGFASSLSYSMTFVGAQLNRWGHGKAERLGCLKVYGNPRGLPQPAVVLAHPLDPASSRFMIVRGSYSPDKWIRSARARISV
jgi:hypothetical protein